MTNDELRHSIPEINNVMKAIYMLSDGKMGKPYLACGEQWQYLKKKLKDQINNFEDKWTFQDLKFLFNPLPHQWGMAFSSKQCDPVIILDPWADKYEIKKYISVEEEVAIIVNKAVFNIMQKVVEEISKFNF